MTKKTKETDVNRLSTNPKNNDPRRNLPSASILLEEPSIKEIIAKYSHILVMDAIHDTLKWFRENLKQGDESPKISAIVEKVHFFLNHNQFERIRAVVNATGVILHTNLGRAVLPQRAVDALSQLNHCCNLQIDLETGQRGKRHYMTEYLLCKITGAEAALIVNNNAAATFLILSALCKGKEVIISRGQLIEIGGSFRLPDCIHQSGAIMVEVGTTNKTHLRDYEQALTENTGIILRVNPSNYRIVGFTEDVPIADLVSLKKKKPVIIVDDQGCGALISLEKYGLPKEPTVQESISAGADLVCFSGDKMISGPQAGIIIGKKELIMKIRKHPFTRMLRVCKLTDMALEQTLRLFLEPEKLTETNPTIRMLTIPAEELKKKAANLKKKLDREKLHLKLEVKEGESTTGGGSYPATVIKSYVLTIQSSKFNSDRLCYLLRQNEPPIISRIKNDEVILDMRTLIDGDEEAIFHALVKIGK